jgi:hypothetical protein
MLSYDTVAIKSFYDVLGQWVAITPVRSFFATWKKQDPITHRIIFDAGFGSSGVNFDTTWASVRTTFELLNKVELPKLYGGTLEATIDSLVTTLNDVFTNNTLFVKNRLLSDRSGIRVHLEDMVDADPSVMKPGSKVGNVLKSFVYSYYLAFPLAVSYNYNKTRVGGFSGFVTKENLAAELYSCADIRVKTSRLYKALFTKLKDKKKFDEFVNSFEDTDSNKLFLSFSTIVRGINNMSS